MAIDNSMRNLILIPLFLIVPMIIFAQKDYETGYIVDNKNDTIIGLVKDRKNGAFGKLYKKIHFKKRHHKKKFGPDQIIAYKKGMNLYESLWFDDAVYPFQGVYVSKPKHGKKVFLKVVVKGYLTYYYLEVEDFESDYIDSVGFYKRNNDDSFARVNQGIFGLKKKTLSKYFHDCPSLVTKMNNGDFNDPVEIANYYNSKKQ